MSITNAKDIPSWQIGFEDGIKFLMKHYTFEPKRTFTFMNKDYLFKKANGFGITIEIDGINVLIPSYLIHQMLKESP